MGGKMTAMDNRKKWIHPGQQ